ncbi:L-type lectin-domain containing receptor kinase IX.1-like [Syzygium oleosum]|uniref:L-type lectin-domain containing receptor kinase IX.1-like n=1 Tax=Syzygium oleosum TaxID=219896 RepID=UPI0024BABC4D|nr:L-type lectin-domain containing receptor kinase IX.1-like [Syzygium oleosum]
MPVGNNALQTTGRGAKEGDYSVKLTKDNIIETKRAGEEGDHSAKLTEDNITEAKRGGGEGDNSARGGEEGYHSATLTEDNITETKRGREEGDNSARGGEEGHHSATLTELNITETKRCGEEGDSSARGREEGHHSATSTQENITETKRGGEEGDNSARGGEEGHHSSSLNEENITETKRGGEESEHSTKLTEEFEKLSGPKKYSYEELMTATGSFAADRILGKGGFGIVYEGHIRGARTKVAVKIINSDSHQGIKEYISEVMLLSQLRHKNLVQLIGYCHEVNKFVLVYEFMREGSLEDHLFKGRTLLTWERRYNIARGLASALHYLHEQCDQCVIHRDIKSSNTMLDEKFNAKLGDFGLARLVDHTRGPNSTQVKGTPGYLAPECYQTGKASKESDIYSFGVVLLELVCGRSVFDSELAAQGGLVLWVWKRYGCRSLSRRSNLSMHWRKKLLRLVDMRLAKDYDEKQAKAFMILGLSCAHPFAGSRPSIEEAMAVLNLKAKPPKLPSKMPRFNI